MDIGPKRLIVQRILDYCLVRIRQHGEEPEAAFQQAIADLPARLRRWADQMEAPSNDQPQRPEPSAFEGYALWAASYDHEPDNPVIAGEEEIIWTLIGDVRGLDVLDVGCGTGRHALPLAAQGARVLGVDPTPEMLVQARQKAKERGLETEFKQGTVEALDPDLGLFDLALCCLVLSHVQHLEGALARLAVHVRPGGRLVVSDFHPFNILVGWRTSCTHRAQKYVVPNHLHLPADYDGAIAAAGLEVTGLYETGRTQRLAGLPMTIVLEARKPR
jgi:2-polyprenyl-3-methyl-5-hydroxy-6-metoxy-1,4-benzoquinol methylase